MKRGLRLPQRHDARLSLTILKESRIETLQCCNLRLEGCLNDAEALAHEIEVLAAIQRDAWRELGSPTLTSFDRREIRNRIRQAETDLRYFLQIRTERLRFRPRPAEPVGDSLARLEFRFFWPRLAYGDDDQGVGGGWRQSDLLSQERSA